MLYGANRSASEPRNPRWFRKWTDRKKKPGDALGRL
jgi:hypothetical protein